ncbi:MAG: cytochrome c [Nitrospira sp.]|nr:cytochrome c [Nitrospira sp.]
MMPRYWLTMFVLCLMVGLPYASGYAASGDPTKGKDIYGKHCLACHGPQGKGDGPTGKAIVPPAADFTSARSKRKSPTELLKVIEEGRANTAMGAWTRQLSDEEIQHVLAYVLEFRK